MTRSVPYFSDRICPAGVVCMVCAEQAVPDWPRFSLFPRWDAFWKRFKR